MASTPPPPTPPTNENASDWRNSVAQSYRSAEVREIAKVLAALEPGASSSSKLMLAMRFEDAVFKSATSLADYRKKVVKRLRKYQKNYVPPVDSGGNDEKDSKSIVEGILLELTQKYGDSLKYIAKRAGAAIADVKSRMGNEKAVQLQQHTDSAIAWAKELGLLSDELEETKSEDKAATATVATTSKKPKQTLDEPRLRKLQQHLERCVEKIRHDVVKHADPDLFLQETLERKDAEMNARASRLLSVSLGKHIQQIQHSSSFDGRSTLQESLDKIQQLVIPPPTRNNNNDVPAALLHLEKLRAASTAVMSYLTIVDRQKTAPRQALEKVYQTAKEGMDFVQGVAKKQQEAQKARLGQKSESDTATSSKTPVVSLQDAWNKVLELRIEETAAAEAVAADAKSSTEQASPSKRPKVHNIKPVTKSRVLLTPKRKTPSHLLPALRRKQARLVRPPPEGRGTHLILEFNGVFCMTIYLSPLLVTIRAMDNKEGSDDSKGESSLSTRDAPTSATWTPLYHGLVGTNGSSSSSGTTSTPNTPKQTDMPLHIWGVSGNYQSSGHVVEERLRDASTHATHILRQCFANHVKDKTVPFEVEILEASALLEFLQLARTTYMPDWQDVEDPVVSS